MPTSAPILTSRDREILLALTRKVRVLTLDQAGRVWWGGTARPEENARGRLRHLATAGLVGELTVMAHPELPVEGPVFRWRPGDTPPSFGEVAYRLQSRWASHAVATPIVFATRRALKLFGGYIADRPPRRTEATHDIHVSTVYLWHLTNAPLDADRWVSEHELYARGAGRNQRLPDARIDGAGRGVGSGRVVEFGGAYPKAKLEEFHAEFEGERYEVW